MEDAANKIGRITTGGVITEFSIPTAGPNSWRYITAGADGNLWFADLYGNIGRITPAGAITVFSIPGGGGDPGMITLGPDGNLWFTENTGNKIGKVELRPVPTNKDECKDGGWMNVYRADGSPFKNQGDCIQYVNTGK